MSERPNPSLAPEHILHLKNEIFSQWEQLPPEHQASAALVLFGKVLSGEYGEWLASATHLLWQDKQGPLGKLLPITGISQAHLTQANLTAEEIAQFTDDDLRRITSDMLDHYANDVFWEELEFVARKALAERRGK